MAESNKQKTVNIVSPDLAEIEKVRDILFGKYVASFERKVETIEKKFSADLNKLTAKIERQMKTTDDKVAKSFERLDANLKKENTGRSQEMKEMQKSLDSARADLQHSIAELEDHAQQDLSSARQLLDEQHQTLVKQLAAAQRKLSKSISDESNKLADDKLGRHVLASMLDDVAGKLRDKK